MPLMFHTLHRLTILAALGLSLLGSASAATMFCVDGPGGFNTTTIDLVADGCISGSSTGYPNGGDGVFSNAGGGDPEAKVEEAILFATGIAIDIALFGASDENPGLFSFTPSGVLTLDTSLLGDWSVLNGALISYITVKAANSFKLFQIDPAASSGGYDTFGLLSPNGSSQPAVSHIRFWTAAPDAFIPEPSTLALTALGMLAAGLLRRRSRSNA